MGDRRKNGEEEIIARTKRVRGEGKSSGSFVEIAKTSGELSELCML